MSPGELAEAWSTAHVANLLSVSNPETGETFGAFVITHDLLQIFSLDPEDDYEVNPNTIKSWRMIFPSEDATTAPEDAALGYAEYFEALKALEPYVLARENGSILVRKLSSEELATVLEAAHGKIDNSLAL